jgi:hypothetical protein
VVFLRLYLRLQNRLPLSLHTLIIIISMIFYEQGCCA